MEQLQLPPPEQMNIPPGPHRDLTMVVAADTSFRDFINNRGEIVGVNPADPAGRLEKEIYLIGQEAQKYDPDSYMGQRLQMADQVRESALHTLELNGNKLKAALRALRQERRQASKAGDYQTVDNIEREIRVLKRTKAVAYPGAEDTVYRLTRRNIDPQFSEKGFLRGLGSGMLKGAFGRFGVQSNNPVMENMRSSRSRAAHREGVVKSVARRRDELRWRRHTTGRAARSS